MIEALRHIVDRSALILPTKERGERVLRDVRRLVELRLQLLGGRSEGVAVGAKLERPVDHLTGVAPPGSRREPSTRGEPQRVQAVEQDGVDLGEPGRTDVGDHVVVHVALVRVERRRAHRVLDRLQPLRQVVGERLLGRLDVLAAIEL